MPQVLPSPPGPPLDSRWRRVAPWIGLGLALCWTVAVRIPLILNADVHLDSDLAVDGLTLLEAVLGRWRWHYPGTPHIGIGPVFLSWIQGKIWGVTPITLVSGGTVAHVLIVLATFALGWRVFGREVAAWSLIPLTFGSTGVLWMSGRITGGHLLIVAWSAGAWLLLHEAWAHASGGRMIVLGLWSGLGLWLDSMFLMTLAGMAVAGLFGAWIGAKGPGRRLPWTAASLAFVAALLAGASPRFIGKAVDPYDAYNEQFSMSLEPSLVAEHGRILVLDCLPRLIAGHRLPGLESDPDPALLGTGGPVQRSSRGREGAGWAAVALTVLALGLFPAALLALVSVVIGGTERGERVVAMGLLATSFAIVAGFLINRNIFNSDNSRYLVLLLIPWGVGLGNLLRTVRQARGWGLPAAAGRRDRPLGTVHGGRGGMVSSTRVDRRSTGSRAAAARSSGAPLAGRASRGRVVVRRLLGCLPARLPDVREGARRALPDVPQPVPRVV